MAEQKQMTRGEARSWASIYGLYLVSTIGLALGMIELTSITNIMRMGFYVVAAAYQSFESDLIEDWEKISISSKMLLCIMILFDALSVFVGFNGLVAWQRVKSISPMATAIESVPLHLKFWTLIIFSSIVAILPEIWERHMKDRKYGFTPRVGKEKKSIWPKKKIEEDWLPSKEILDEVQKKVGKNLIVLNERAPLGYVIVKDYSSGGKKKIKINIQ